MQPDCKLGLQKKGVGLSPQKERPTDSRYTTYSATLRRLGIPGNRRGHIHRHDVPPRVHRQRQKPPRFGHQLGFPRTRKFRRPQHRNAHDKFSVLDRCRQHGVVSVCLSHYRSPAIRASCGHYTLPPRASLWRGVCQIGIGLPLPSLSSPVPLVLSYDRNPHRVRHLLQRLVQRAVVDITIHTLVQVTVQ